MVEHCFACSFKHLGSAKERLIEAASASDPERRRKKYAEVMDALQEAESHVAKYPEKSARIRDLRKKVEQVVLEGAPGLPVSTEEIEDTRWDMIKSLAEQKVDTGVILPPTPLGPATTTSSSSNGSNIIVPILIVLGLATLGAAVYIFTRKEKETKKGGFVEVKQ